MDDAITKAEDLAQWQANFLCAANGSLSKPNPLEEPAGFKSAASIHSKQSARVQLYSRNYSQGLSAWLAKTYPRTLVLLGADRDNSIDQFLDHHKLTHDNLWQFEQSFIGHLDQKLQTFARCEWLMSQAYYAANPPVFDFNAFANLSPQQQAQTIFKLDSNLYFLESTAPLAAWSSDADYWTLAEVNHQTLPQSQTWMIGRADGRRAFCAQLDQAGLSLVAAIQANTPMAQLPDISNQTALAWIENGWICGFQTSH